MTSRSISFVIASVFVFLNAEPIAAATADEAALSNFAEVLQRKLDRRALYEGSANAMFAADEIETAGSDDGHPGGPSDDPVNDDDDEGYSDIDVSSLDLPFAVRKSGAAELIALETLYQTLMFYGVVHIVERKGDKKTFKVVQSKSGYFKHLTTLDVAFAMRVFSMYVSALLCNDPSLENFSALLNQSKPGEIGLRFKYDMAWALLGNHLPKDANDIFRMGTKWKAFTQILSTTQSLKKVNESSLSQLRSWVGGLNDVMNVVVRLNRLQCFVDIRPDPREELKKKVVIRSLLDMEKRLFERYGELKELVDQIDAAAAAEKISGIKK